MVVERLGVEVVVVTKPRVHEVVACTRQWGQEVIANKKLCGAVLGTEARPH